LITRRRVMQAAGIGAGLVAAPAWAAARPGVVEAETLWSWNERVADFGCRLTGSRAHTRYVDWLADELEATGLRVHRDRLTFTRWSPRRWNLTIDGSQIDLAFYWPYSGVTPPEGVTAPLQYLGPSPVDSAAFAAAAGKIAVVEVPTPPLSVFAAFPELGRYAPDMASPDPATHAPAITDIALGPLLEVARETGVLGVVCIRVGASDALANDQYSPFTTGYQDCPAVWVGPTAGQEVRHKAIAGAAATLVMDAEITEGAATDTIWAVLPGMDPREAVVVNTHTDGPNVAEENGGLGLLALAREHAAVPRARRRRSLIFLATTGHFQLPQFAVGQGQSASRWIVDHPELVDGQRMKTVAALTLEHLGCREWTDDPAANSYGPSGRKDVAYCFTTTRAMTDLYLGASSGTRNNRTIAAQPAFQFGEGHDFTHEGIPGIALIPAPTYLVAAPDDGALARLDKRYMHGQVRAFSRVIRRLDDLSAAELGTPAPSA
jgi:hypothetical protein